MKNAAKLTVIFNHKCRGLASRPVGLRAVRPLPPSVEAHCWPHPPLESRCSVRTECSNGCSCSPAVRYRAELGTRCAGLRPAGPAERLVTVLRAAAGCGGGSSGSAQKSARLPARGGAGRSWPEGPARRRKKQRGRPCGPCRRTATTRAQCHEANECRSPPAAAPSAPLRVSG